jgi:hypothetical protein
MTLLDGPRRFRGFVRESWRLRLAFRLRWHGVTAAQLEGVTVERE